MSTTRPYTFALVLIIVSSTAGTAQELRTASFASIFQGPDGQPLDGPGFVRLRVANEAGTQSDEALVVFTSGSPATDGEDVPKFSFSHPTAPRIATLGDGSVLLAINAYGPFTTAITIPVMLKVANSGTYTIAATGLADLGYSCFTLEDPATGSITTLFEGASSEFAALAAADPNTPRFLLHASEPLLFTPSSPLCAGDANGSAQVELPEGPADVRWFGEGGQLLAQADGMPAGTTALSGLAAGRYTFQALGISACGALKLEFELEEPAPLEVVVTVTAASCPGSADGMITLGTEGGSMPYNYLWNNGYDGSYLSDDPGVYSVVITDANGCVWASDDHVIEDGIGPTAAFEPDTDVVMVGEAVAFFSDSDPELDHFWDFGDGTTGSGIDPEHAYAIPGTYTVSLTVSDGSCEHSAERTLSVEAGTGLLIREDHGFKAWFSN
ncbi:MAG: PKD domain-containing protein, partial [Flavobacteriales bacterium]|nr:PKD domain-containing protein [Flavobacteriales bacterium]